MKGDLYDMGGKIYSSELTFILTGGNMKLTPASMIDDWGTMLNYDREGVRDLP